MTYAQLKELIKSLLIARRESLQTSDSFPSGG